MNQGHLEDMRGTGFTVYISDSMDCPLLLLLIGPVGAGP